MPYMDHPANDSKLVADAHANMEASMHAFALHLLPTFRCFQVVLPDAAEEAEQAFPVDGEGFNEELAKALSSKSEFTQEEWEAFDVQGLRMSHFIKSGENYYRPADREFHGRFTDLRSTINLIF